MTKKIPFITKLSETRWRLQIRRKGFHSVDKVFSSKEDAAAARDHALGQHMSSLNPRELTLSQAWEKYRDSLDFSNKSQQTQKTEIARIKPVLSELGGYSLENLKDSPHIIYDYMDRRSKHISDRTKKRLSATSLRLELAALSSVIAWAKRRKIFESNFMRHIDRPSQTKRKRRVPSKEQALLFITTREALNPQTSEAARFMLLLRHLGCRPGELANLRRRDVDLDQKEIVFRQTKYNKEDRTVHTVISALPLLREQLDYSIKNFPDSEFLFSTRSLRPNSEGKHTWNPYNYSSAVKRLRKEKIVAHDFHAHAMRREFISRAIESNMPYSTIRKQTGHHSTQAIEIYDEGLSTAPEIREILEQHDHKVSIDQMKAYVENITHNAPYLDAVKKILDSELKKSPQDHDPHNHSPAIRKTRKKSK